MRISFSRKQAAIGTSIILFVLLAGFLAWWALYYNNPNRILANALSHLSQAESAGFNGSLSGGGINFTFEGDTTRQATALHGTLTVGSLALKGQIKADSNTTYIQLDNAKGFAQKATAAPFTAAYGTQFALAAEALQGKWLKIADEANAVDNSCAKLFSTAALSADQQQQLRNLFRQHQFVSVAEKLGTQQLNGQPHLRYKLQFNQAKAQDFTTELLKIEPFKSSKTCLSIGSDKAAQKLFEKVAQTDIQVWVHERTHTLTKITAVLSEKDLTLNFTLNLDLGKQVQVTMPTTDIIPLKGLLETIKNGRKSL